MFNAFILRQKATTFKFKSKLRKEMDRSHNNRIILPSADDQVIGYEEVFDEGNQFMDDSDNVNQELYYGEYVEVEGTSAIETEPAVYYEQVIEEKPSVIRPAEAISTRASTYATISPAASYYHNQSRYAQQRFNNSPAMPIRPFNQMGVRPLTASIQQPKPSIVYTPSALSSTRREIGAVSGANIFSPNFPFLLSHRTPKPSKMRKVASKKKPCNCTKSMCLKLYCDCFASGEFCLDCNCKDCHNNLEHEAERSRAIKSSLERNPSAFKPKIGVAAKAASKSAVDMERLHQKGCHCKKSNCLKNYCECYEAKVPCTERCKCQSCRNTEQDRHHKFKDKFTTAGGLAQLAAAAAADSRARPGSPYSDFEGSDVAEREDQQVQLNPKSQPWFYMTEDVIEATTLCLVSQAKDYEQTLTDEELERSVLKEFGRCLEQIIESASGPCTSTTPS